MIYLLAVLHAFVDASCAAKLYSAAGSLSLLQISIWFLLYNLLAFSTQGIIGGVLDAVVQRQTLFSAQMRFHDAFASIAKGAQLGRSMWKYAVRGPPH